MARAFDTLRVIGKSLQVLWDQRLDEKYAAFDPDKFEVSLQAGVRGDELRESLLHELLHALDHQLDLRLSERKTRQLSVGMFALMRDNPALAEFLFTEKG